MFDGITEVFGEDIPSRLAFGCRLWWQATLKLSRSGTGQALFARQGRVPWHQHAANGISRQSAASVFTHPQAFAEGTPYSLLALHMLALSMGVRGGGHGDAWDAFNAKF